MNSPQKMNWGCEYSIENHSNHWCEFKILEIGLLWRLTHKSLFLLVHTACHMVSEDELLVVPNWLMFCWPRLRLWIEGCVHLPLRFVSVLWWHSVSHHRVQERLPLSRSKPEHLDVILHLQQEGWQLELPLGLVCCLGLLYLLTCAAYNREGQAGQLYTKKIVN